MTMTVETTTVAESLAPAKAWTYDDLAQLHDEKRYEIYDGELFEMPSPTIRHQQIVGLLYVLLRAWAQASNAGKLYLSPTDLRLSSGRTVIPDLMFARRERFEANERIEREDGQCLIAPPDLIIEVLSPATARHDHNAKRGYYADFGVRHYWLLDPDANTLQAFTLDNARYFWDGTWERDDTFTLDAFPGLQLAVSDVFAS